jgi:hypothetical protein
MTSRIAFDRMDPIGGLSRVYFGNLFAIDPSSIALKRQVLEASRTYFRRYSSSNSVHGRIIEWGEVIPVVRIAPFRHLDSLQP